MKPMLLWLQKRHEANAEASMKRPVRYALILFGVMLVLMEIGTVGTFYADVPDHLDSLNGAILITLGIALWCTLMMTGWMLTPIKIRKRIYYSLMLVPWAGVIIGSLYYALLIKVGVKALHWVIVLNNSLLVVCAGILIALTFVSVWGWVRYMQGHAVD